jgi:DNA repair protein RadD
LYLSTGAGKSHIAAAIAKWITENTNKKVLVLQPSKELTEQNYSKWIATGEKASIFSASAGAKCTRHAVVYATPKTVLNSIERFGDMFGCVIVDECHQITPTIKDIISKIKAKNPMLRVIGMTATPYRMNTGYIIKT